MTDWAVRHRRLPAYAWWPRTVRRIAGPLLTPLESRLRRAGANPVDAPLWLLGAVMVAGLLTINLVGWLAGSLALLTAMQGAAPGAWILLVVNGAIWLILAAIVVRVIGSWVGVGRFTGWMRPVFLLTDWIVLPIARRMPAMGMIDLSPFVAYLLLLVLRSLLAGAVQ